MSLNGLLQANNATAATVIRPGAEVCLPAGAASTTAAAATARSCVSERTVAAGESWYMISRSTGVPIDALVAANNASRSSAIYPGQSLCLPEVGFGRDLPSVVLEPPPSAARADSPTRGRRPVAVAGSTLASTSSRPLALRWWPQRTAP